MEETFSKNFKRFFLLTLTKELIKQSAKRDIFKLQNIIESEEQKKRERFPTKPIFTKEIKEIKSVQKPIEIQAIRKPSPTEIEKRPLVKRFTKPIARVPLFIPEPKLPPHLEYLKPIPTPGIEIDLFKLNPLIKDPAVRIIEANPDERVIVIGTMGTKPTDIILNKEDIDRVIDKFSEVSKIPVNEGIYRVVVGNLILSAIISESIGSKFIIKKMIVSPTGKQQQQLPILPTLPFQK